jgi:hypothetical protein
MWQSRRSHRLMRFACWINKATETIAICNTYCFPRPQWVHWRVKCVCSDVYCLSGTEPLFQYAKPRRFRVCFWCQKSLVLSFLPSLKVGWCCSIYCVYSLDIYTASSPTDFWLNSKYWGLCCKDSLQEPHATYELRYIFMLFFIQKYSFLVLPCV